MGIQLEDGKGTGILQAVNDEGLARTLTVAGSLSGHASNDDGDAFTVFGTANITSGIVVALHIVNNDPELLFLVDRVTVQGIGLSGGVFGSGTPIPSQTAFFSLGYNRTVSTGGSGLNPVCINRTSINIANVTATGFNPTMNATPTFVESQRWYIQANGWAYDLVIPREDDIILGRTNTIEIRYTSDNTSGTVLASMKFIMRNAGEMP
jgi:hypothetical protein